MSIRTIFFLFLSVFALYGLFTVGLPFLLAFLLAFLLEPLVLLISRGARLKRSYASALVSTIFVLFILGLGYFLVAKVASEAAGLAKSLLSMTSDVNQQIDVLTSKYLSLFWSLPPEYQQGLQQISRALLEAIQGILNQIAPFFIGLAKIIPNFLIELLIIVISLFLISLRLPNMKYYLLQFFTPRVHQRVETVLKNLQQAIFGFMRAQIIISFIIFAVVLTGLVILDISYASATALLITIVDIFPILGTGSVLIPMALYNYINGNMYLGTGLLIHYGVIVAVRRAIEPKILGESLGIGPLSTLVSMYIAVQLAGFIGIFLGPAIIILFQALIKVGILKIKINFD